jgi:hypothetical protein
VIWDYHVILLGAGRIWDFDSTLTFPSDAARYVRETMRPEMLLKEEFQRYIPGTDRGIDGAGFIELLRAMFF